MIFIMGLSFARSFDLHIENQAGGFIWTEESWGKQTIGRVIKPAEIGVSDGYRATKWGVPGSAVGVSSNALHILVKKSENSEKTSILTLAPKESETNENIYLRDMTGAIQTDISGGLGIFGELSPKVGNKVFVSRKNNTPQLISQDYTPQLGDEWIIKGSRRTREYKQIWFENRYDGRVVGMNSRGQKRILARVLRPVMGTGRFEGSQYMPGSRVRANHPGVICISTTPKDENDRKNALETRGGFQIIPSVHAMDEEMIKDTLTRTQWMVVGPLNIKDKSLEGQYPLFSGLFTPGMKVQMRIDDGEWEDLPEITGKVEDAFTPSGLIRYYQYQGTPRQVIHGMTHLRIICED